MLYTWRSVLEFCAPKAIKSLLGEAALQLQEALSPVGLER